MTPCSRRSMGRLAAAALLVSSIAPLALAQNAAARNRALFQVSDNDPARWALVLRNMQNLRDGVPGESVEIELVAYGPGLLMLRGDSSVKDGVAEALKSGVVVKACQNTMAAMKLAPADMLPDIGYVPAGVVEVMRKQREGWGYIRS